MQQFDVLIIGGGMAGLSIAAECAQSNRIRVAVLERETQCAYHSTGRSAAKFIENYGNPEVRKLNRVSRQFFQRTPYDVWEHALLQPRGLFYVALPGHEHELDGLLADSQGIEAVAPDAISKLMPIVNRGAIAAALYEADGQDIDVNELVQGYRRLLRRHGGILQCDAEVQTLQQRNGLWQVRTKAGDFAAPVVVNAAGAWADTLAGLAGLEPVGIQPMRRSVAITPLPEGLDGRHWPFIVSSAEDYYFGPEAGKLLLSSAEETPVEPHDAYADDMALAEAVYKIQALINFEIKRIEHSWGGLRSFAPDRTQVIGFDPRAEGFFWLAGQGGYGIQSGPGAALLAAALLTNTALPDVLQSEDIDPACFAVERLL